MKSTNESVYIIMRINESVDLYKDLYNYYLVYTFQISLILLSATS